MEAKKRTINKISQLSLSKKLAHCRELDALIRSGNTGNLDEVAKTLSITTQLTFALIQYMKEDLHCPIVFIEADQNFVYTKSGELIIGFLKADANSEVESSIG